jgi:hypothetical protein
VYFTLDELDRHPLLKDDPVWRRLHPRIQIGQVPIQAPEMGPCLTPDYSPESTGYTQIRAGKGLEAGRMVKKVATHKWLWEKLNGPVPEGYELDHVCHDYELCKPPRPNLCPHRPCILHVELKTVAENRLRSQSACGHNSRKMHCESKYSPRDANGKIIGHDWSIPGNVRTIVQGGRLKRSCVPCDRLRQSA